MPCKLGNGNGNGKGNGCRNGCGGARRGQVRHPAPAGATGQCLARKAPKLVSPAIQEGREANSSVATMFNCYPLLHYLEQPLNS